MWIKGNLIAVDRGIVKGVLGWHGVRGGRFQVPDRASGRLAGRLTYDNNRKTGFLCAKAFRNGFLYS